MARSMFTMGFAANPWFGMQMGNPGSYVGPIHINMTEEEILRNARELLKMQPVPPGWVGTYPKIVKINTSGEFIVYADGRAQYISYGRGSVGPRIQI
jgi:hypothetical protein